jgi:tetratricopeptide (TPR) repeat protein
MANFEDATIIYPDANAVFACVDRISNSGVLGQSSRLRHALEYIVAEELSGRGSRLKAYSIAIEVFGRDDSFDASVDSIVRVEFRRLRQALDQYYSRAEDGIRIQVPPGGYRPTISFASDARAEVSTDRAPVLPRQNADPEKTLTGRWLTPLQQGLIIGSLLAAAVFGLAAYWFAPHLFRETEEFEGKIVVSLEPVKWPTGNNFLTEVSTGLNDQLTVELGKYSFLVLQGGDTTGFDPKPIDNNGRRQTLSLTLQQETSKVRMIARLSDSNSVQMWGRSYDTTAATSLAAQDDLIFRFLDDLRPQLFIAANKLSERISKSNTPASAWSLFVESTWAPTNEPITLDWEKKRIELAQAALAIDPEFGPAHSVLAQKFSAVGAVVPDFDTLAQQNDAAQHANQAILFAADDVDSLFNVAVYYWNIGNLEQANVLLKRVSDLDRSHLLARTLFNKLRYTCEAAPPNVIAEVQKTYDRLEPGNPGRWVLQSFLNSLHISAGNKVDARTQGISAYMSFNAPETFLRYAAALEIDGQREKARNVVQLQKLNWPGLKLRHVANNTVANRCKGIKSSSNFQMSLLRLADFMEEQ